MSASDKEETMSTGDPVILAFVELLNQLTLNKPNDRSEADRAFAIVKTEVEKAFAYYVVFVAEARQSIS